MFKDNLKKYIKNDITYNLFKQNPDAKLSDFEEFCLQHCLDIKYLLQENENLQYQLKEKDKIIDEMLNFTFDSYCPYECFCDEEPNECDKVKKLCNCGNCKDTYKYKKCWLKYFENKIKEVK